MKQLFFLSLFMKILTFTGSAQLIQPVKWKYTAKKIDDTNYEITLTADIKSPWHIYSQSTPDGGPLPTRITFNNNPLVVIKGKAKEKGKLIKRYEEVFGVDVKYFYGNVDFLQTVKLKKGIKTNITGSIEFMACNDEQCMPPAEVKFSILLQ